MKNIGLCAVFFLLLCMNITAKNAHQKACFANIRVLSGAVEMHNADMDETDMMNELEIALLVEKGYLKDYPICPARGTYLGRDLHKDGFIICNKHKNPGYKNAVKKACKANSRVLAGAVEMFNMDHDKQMQTLDIKLLVKEGYLKGTPKCKGKGKYSLKKGKVVCSKHDKSCSHPGKKACFANIRVLAGAVEMHNADSDETDMMYELDIDVLVNKGYLKDFPTCPAKGNYSGNDLDKKGRISCNKHKNPYFKNDALKKNCRANMRVLMGAVEMYNMDYTEMMNNLDIARLVKKQYLKRAPQCPKNGDYSGSNLTADGIVKCSVHGEIH
ncbi:hypothetical protein ACFL35_15700 [Candidatus Riflebacteria bacterium]